MKLVFLYNTIKYFFPGVLPNVLNDKKPVSSVGSISSSNQIKQS